MNAGIIPRGNMVSSLIGISLDIRHKAERKQQVVYRTSFTGKKGVVMGTSRSRHAHREKTPLSDAEIRPVLRSQILDDYGDEQDNVLIEELGLCRGQVRVDMALVNGHIHGFEIKSDQDSLKRLSGQAEIYNKVFDHMTMVVGKRHMDGVLASLPPFGGALSYDSLEICIDAR